MSVSIGVVAVSSVAIGSAAGTGSVVVNSKSLTKIS